MIAAHGSFINVQFYYFYSYLTKVGRTKMNFLHVEK